MSFTNPKRITMGTINLLHRRKSIGPCAKKCKGKTKGKFRKCVKKCMR